MEPHRLGLHVSEPETARCPPWSECWWAGHTRGVSH